MKKDSRIMAFIRSISGLRATLGSDLSPELIVDYALAFAKLSPEGPVILGRDGRPSGSWIESIVAGALASSGKDVIMAGIVPTPTVQLIAEHSSAAGGIAITASHNPSEWNGLKFIDKNGVFLDAQANKLLWKIVDSRDFCIHSDNFGKIKYIDDANRQHIEAIFQIPIFQKTDLINKIREKRYKIVVDAVNASGSVIVPMLLKELNCNIVELYCDGSGMFPHSPEPLPVNLGDLAERTRLEKADLGIAVDPDADRLVLIDNNGLPIGEEKTIALSAMAVLKNIQLFNEYERKLVVNYSTTRLVEDIGSRFGAITERSAVGEINVVSKMKHINAVIGGEGSGGVILPSCHYGRDSLVGIALTLCLLAQENVSLSELNSSLPNYEMLKLKKTFSGDIRSILDKIENEFSDGKSNREDGIRIDFGNSWVQLRASNTEPIIRIIAEAPTKEESQHLASRAMSLVD